MNILLGVTGSVAASLTEKLVMALISHKVAVVTTDKAMEFHRWSAFTDKDEWEKRYKKGDPILHIDLAKWAEVFLIAPCSANSLAKIANGLADNLLTCCARAWDYKKPLILAPSMNCQMWYHPITEEHLNKIVGWGGKFIPPQEKMLACGDFGMGAMAQIKDILKLLPCN